MRRCGTHKRDGILRKHKQLEKSYVYYYYTYRLDNFSEVDDLFPKRHRFSEGIYFLSSETNT